METRSQVVRLAKEGSFEAFLQIQNWGQASAQLENRKKPIPSPQIPL